MRWKSLLTAFSLVATLAALLAVPALPAGATTGSCTNVSVPVTLGGAPWRVKGSLCTPDTYAGGVRRVDVLVHGGTYNSSYWNWPLQPDRYSYVRKTTHAGRAAFAYDRPGSVAGGLPPSVSLTAGADADVLHQLIAWLRGQSFRQVTVVGHSLGSIISVAESGTYNDADRLVVTGLLHHQGDAPPPQYYQASLDPQFAGVVTDPGYLTTVPGTRGAAFYDTASADPNVIAYDEAHKDVMSADEAGDAAAHVIAPAGQNDANKVRIPVLLVVGQNDRNYCGTTVDCSTADGVRASEAAYYTSAPSLTALPVPATGHSITLHPSADQSFASIDRWIKTH
jgi:pimeloyl-ACP methyl ester carboxylesterase